MKKLRLSDADKYILSKFRVYEDSNSGYYRIYVSRCKYIYLHRFIMGAKTGQVVDHINRNKFDNRKTNLRFVTSKLNAYNRDVENELGRGIYFDKYGNRFRACISDNNKTLKLGSFKTIVDAKLAYNKKSMELYGDDAFQHDV